MAPWQFTFTLAEILSLIGLTQCVYILVYIAFRAGDMKRAVLPIVYFLFLGCAFFLDFATRFIGGATAYYDIMQWFSWYAGPPLGVLLAIQVAQINRVPPLKNFTVLLFLPLALLTAAVMARTDESCIFPAGCAVLDEWLVVTGLIAGLVSMAALWLQRGLMTALYHEKGRDRYWLVIMLVSVNILFLGAMFLGLSFAIRNEEIMMIRTLLGLGFVYLAGTSLFRIYPRALELVDRRAKGDEVLSVDDKALGVKIEALLDLDKVYHEPSYSRSDMARELNVPEASISRIISQHFSKTLPQLLNERRVEDAKRLLRETDAPIQVIASEAGFNSTASFNRVFRAITGLSPSEYRKAPEG